MKQALKAFSKSIFKSYPVRWLACFLLALYIRIVRWSGRLERVIAEQAQPYMRGDRHAIFCFWHGRLMMMCTVTPPQRRLNVMISFHRDGEWLAQTLRNFGIGMVYGSSRRGGAEAARDALRVLADKQNLGITPDGPKGPAYRAQMGAASIARMAGVPIIPCGFSASRYRQMKSWDAFMFIYPFSKLVLTIGDPIAPATDESGDDNIRQQLEDAMNQCMADADKLATR